MRPLTAASHFGFHRFQVPFPTPSHSAAHWIVSLPHRLFVPPIGVEYLRSGQPRVACVGCESRAGRQADVRISGSSSLCVLLWVFLFRCRFEPAPRRWVFSVQCFRVECTLGPLFSGAHCGRHCLLPLCFIQILCCGRCGLWIPVLRPGIFLPYSAWATDFSIGVVWFVSVCAYAPLFTGFASRTMFSHMSLPFL